MKSFRLLHRLKNLIAILHGWGVGHERKPHANAAAPGPRQVVQESNFERELYFDESDVRYHNLSYDLAEIMGQIAQARQQQRGDAFGFDR